MNDENLIDILMFLLRYAKDNNKSIVLPKKNTVEFLVFVEKGLEDKTNHYVVDEKSIEEYYHYSKNTISIGFHDKITTPVLSCLKSLPNSEVIGYVVDFKKRFSHTINFLPSISFKDILKHAVDNEDSSIELLNTIHPSSFFQLKKETDSFCFEIKNDKLSKNFCTFLVGYFLDKKANLEADKNLKELFSQTMMSLLRQKPEMSTEMIKHYDFLKDVFDKYEPIESCSIDFKRLRLDLVGLNLEVKNPEILIQDIVYLMQENKRLKDLGLAELVLHEKNTNFKDIFISLSGNSKISYSQVESLIKETIYHCASYSDKSLYTKVLDIALLDLVLDKKTQNIKAIKI